MVQHNEDGARARGVKQDTLLEPNHSLSKKRLHTFVKRFSLDDDTGKEENLIDVYSCAHIKDLAKVVQGHLFITNERVCFYSKILGLKTSVSLTWKSIETVRKEKTVFVIPNALSLETSERKYTFTSFLSRNSAFKRVKALWMQKGLGRSMMKVQQYSTSAAESQNTLELSNSADCLISTSSSCALYTPRVEIKKSAEVNSDSSSPDGSPPKDSSSSSEENETKQHGYHSETSHDIEFKNVGTAGASHPPVEILDMEFSMASRTMFEGLFSDSCQFMRRYYHNQKVTGLNIGSYLDNAKGLRTRKINYVLPINIPFGPKITETEETQTILRKSSPHSYLVEVQSFAKNVPYGDSFVVVCLYRISYVKDNRCRLRCYLEINFIRSVYTVVKKFVNHHVSKSAEASLQKLVGAIQDTISAPGLLDHSKGPVHRHTESNTTATTLDSVLDDNGVTDEFEDAKESGIFTTTPQMNPSTPWSSSNYSVFSTVISPRSTSVYTPVCLFLLALGFVLWLLQMDVARQVLADRIATLEAETKLMRECIEKLRLNLDHRGRL